MTDFVIDAATTSSDPDFFETEPAAEEPISTDTWEKENAEEIDMEEHDDMDHEVPDYEDGDENYEDYDKDVQEWQEEEWMEYSRNKKVGLFVSIFFATFASLKSFYFAMHIFRYTRIDDYWKNGEIDDNTNWWKIGNMIMNWSGFTVFATLALS